EGALRASASRLKEWLETKEKSNGSTPVLPDLGYTLGARRNHHQHRLTLVAHSSADVIQELGAYTQNPGASKVRSSFSPRREHPPRIAFVMSGQGPQWWGMGRELMLHEPVFRGAIEACDDAMRVWNYSLLEDLSRDE